MTSAAHRFEIAIARQSSRRRPSSASLRPRARVRRRIARDIARTVDLGVHGDLVASSRGAT